jgi:hypothetical protein
MDNWLALVTTDSPARTQSPLPFDSRRDSLTGALHVNSSVSHDDFDDHLFLISFATHAGYDATLRQDFIDHVAHYKYDRSQPHLVDSQAAQYKLRRLLSVSFAFIHLVVCTHPEVFNLSHLPHRLDVGEHQVEWWMQEHWQKLRDHLRDYYVAELGQGDFAAVAFASYVFDNVYKDVRVLFPPAAL